jgi:DNA-directed RNA polymerase alpha subunit
MPRKQNDETTSAFPPGIGQPAFRAFVAAGYASLGQLAQAREADLRKLHGVGPKALGVIREALAARGLAFADADRESP